MKILPDPAIYIEVDWPPDLLARFTELRRDLVEPDGFIVVEPDLRIRLIWGHDRIGFPVPIDPSALTAADRGRLVALVDEWRARTASAAGSPSSGSRGLLGGPA